MVVFDESNVFMRVGELALIDNHVLHSESRPKIRYPADVHHVCAPADVHASARSWVDQLAEINWPSLDTHHWETRQDDRAARPVIFAIGWDGEATLALVAPLLGLPRWEAAPIAAPIDVLRWVMERRDSWD